jgi:hypothetical protein
MKQILKPKQHMIRNECDKYLRKNTSFLRRMWPLNLEALNFRFIDPPLHVGIRENIIQPSISPPCIVLYTRRPSTHADSL